MNLQHQTMMPQVQQRIKFYYDRKTDHNELLQEWVNIKSGDPILEDSVLVPKWHPKDAGILCALQLLNPLIACCSICVWYKTSHLEREYHDVNTNFKKSSNYT